MKLALNPQADTAKTVLLAALAVVTAYYLIMFVRAVILQSKRGTDFSPTPTGLGTGFVTNFFDTLGIGSFATTTAVFRFLKVVPDEKIPGTLNVGHTLSAITQTFIFTKIVPVQATTLILMIVAAVLGSCLGAGVVSRMSRSKIQSGMGFAMLAAGALLLLSLLGSAPGGGGEALGVWGVKLGIAFAGNFVLGVLMTLGIGLYAPCLILVGLLGMNVRSAFPIMMGSCAFLMPFASVKFMKTGRFDAKAALGLAMGSVPAVLVAAYIVKGLTFTALRWVVLVVIVYTGITLLRAATRERPIARDVGGLGDRSVTDRSARAVRETPGED